MRDDKFNTWNKDDAAVFEEMHVNADQDPNVEQRLEKDVELENLEIFAVNIAFEKSTIEFQRAWIEPEAQKKSLEASKWRHMYSKLETGHL